MYTLRAVLATVAMAAAAFGAESATTKRLADSATVFQEVMGTNDKAIPQDLLEKAHCVVIVPGLKKGGFILGAKYGKGFASCRKVGAKGWGAPMAMRVEGGSVGFQIGGAETDVIMLVMNQKGASRLLESKFTVGGEGTVAAGPVGRDATAQTDATMRAEILSWSRSRGAFAGIALQGATLRQDLDDNKEMYGKTITNKEIFESSIGAPADAKPLLGLLNKYSPSELK